ncbi:catecholate siderophore receptor Fiu [Pseudomonas sp. PDM16]|uniref:catecholate siderophore receptor Fiu n=1 Tax=Pseudomonas sp. PDM16 TaxID=2769292 RepID=UPI00177B3421|nr:catecholate siderophore receptor Fiu [Pseudomonas sp. PDM16]MBD9416872.1 catecholate siderophore receptor Fiu [Pseudomonas sp. PDM16]
MSIRSRKHQKNRQLAALVVAAVPAMSMSVQADEVSKDLNLPATSITSKAEAQYRVTKSANAKMTEPLLDTPKTIQVINKEVMREQGATTLMEALRNTPGITMQMGENGNTALGDTFMMRGFSTQNSTFVDGVRDLGAITRDVFNTEQVEVVKGPSGTDSGRGSASGYINMVSKLPSLENSISGTLGYGTADKKAITADINQQIGDGSAVRLNLARRDGGVDERDYVENTNFGVAPSIAFGLDGDTRVYLYSYHLRQENVPDGGIPAIGMDGYYNSNPLLNSAPKVDRENFYGSPSDYEDAQADMFTLKLEHDLNDVTTVRNISRWGRSSIERVLTGAFSITAPTTPDRGTWTVTRSRQYGDQANDVLANLTNLTTEFDTFGLRNSLSSGIEFSKEEQLTRTGAVTGLSTTLANLYNPNPHDQMADPFKTGARNSGETGSVAVYVFDTLHFDEQWSINGGLRYEDYETDYKTRAADGVVTKLDVSDQLLTWNAGVVFKPLPNGSIYLSYADSQTPPGNSFTISSAAGNINNPSADPQETRHVELGTKWDLLDDQLSLTLAAYRTENENQVTQDEITLESIQEGKTRVDGVELGMVGQITENWQITAGVAHMKTKQLDQQSVNATTGVVTQTSGVRWSPELTGTLWTTYKLGKLTLGGGARYVDEQKRLITSGTAVNAATTSLAYVPSYWVADAMASYQVSENVNLRLNVYNLFDEDYFDVNNGGTRVRYGDPRSAMFTTELAF